MSISANSAKRHTNIPASYLVLINQNNEVLLLRRYNTGFKDGMYSLVAGHVDAGETFTTALIREAKEEAGITIEPNAAVVAHMLHRKSDTDGSERVDVFFTVREWEGEIVNLEPEKCDGLHWFSFDELPENTIDYIRVALQHIANEVRYSEMGW